MLVEDEGEVEGPGGYDAGSETDPEDDLITASDTGFIDDTLTKDDATLCFIWSQPYTTDEVKRREKLIHLGFLGFLEALARLVCFKPMPTPAQVAESNAGSASQFLQLQRDGTPGESNPAPPPHLLAQHRTPWLA